MWQSSKPAAAILDVFQAHAQSALVSTLQAPILKIILSLRLPSSSVLILSSWQLMKSTKARTCAHEGGFPLAAADSGRCS